MQCKAAVLESAPGPLVIGEIDVDSPAPDEILVRTVAAGVCHSDLHFMEGKYPYPLPVVLGHESAGVVEAVGDRVTGFAPGDHVITCLSVFCGRCDYCLSGRPQLCSKEGVLRPASAPPRLSRDGQPVHQFLFTSSFAEYMLVHQHGAVKIREDMPLDKAALIGCGVTTGAGAVINTAGVRPGETVAVVGCGGIGLSALQGAVIAGAGRVIAIDRVASKLDLARRFGATDVINAAEVDAVAAVRELTAGGVEHSFEAVGVASAAQQCFDMLRPGGTATIIGMIPVGEKVEIDGPSLLQEKRIQGSTMGSNRFRVDMPRYVDMYLAGKLDLDSMVSGTIGLEGINEAYDELKLGEVARQIVLFD
ncbi:Zn-dependent alcohol dehydrogenase [Saccharopolyspora cebuensis]|uniref:Zn-dependent alcohol dehydrogenase n=1 Tax=Saccharopolyspora cebuensis TaxID=418759 RepID=A0ABV4CIK4_9PSEU